MPYPEPLVAPMRQELVTLGFRELRTPDDVDTVLQNVSDPVLVVVNSVCGCAAGAMRPGVALSLRGEESPPALTTVFAGQDIEATAKAREYFAGYAPSSPSIALLKEGELVWMLERHQIEGRGPDQIAATLKSAYREHSDSGAAA